MCMVSDLKVLCCLGYKGQLNLVYFTIISVLRRYSCNHYMVCKTYLFWDITVTSVNLSFL